MKLIELLNEAPKKKSTKDYGTRSFIDFDVHDQLIERATKVVNFLNNRCSPWLSQTNNGKKIVYRGDEEYKEKTIVYKKHVRQDRKPRDSKIEDHNISNEIFKKMGLVANRSNSSFVIGDIITTGNYGASYVLIPIGNFNYTWSPNVEDLTRDVFDEWNYQTIKYDGTVLPQGIEIAKKNYIKLQTNDVNSMKERLSELLSEKDKIQVMIDTPTLKNGKEKSERTRTRERDKLKDIKKSIDVYTPMIAGRNANIKKMQTCSTVSGMKKIHVDITDYLSANAKKKYIAKKPDIEILMKKPMMFGKYRGDDDSLIKAINSNHEIMISSKEVLMMDPTFYKTYVLPILDNKKPRRDSEIIHKIINGKYN